MQEMMLKMMVEMMWEMMLETMLVHDTSPYHKIILIFLRYKSMIYYIKCMVHSCRLGIFDSTIDSRELRRRGRHSASSSSQSPRSWSSAQEIELTSRDKLYSGGRKPIYSGVFRNRQWKSNITNGRCNKTASENRFQET
jgi:hypothetical protein